MLKEIKVFRSNKAQSIIIQFVLFFIIGFGIFIGMGSLFKAQSDIFKEDVATASLKLSTSYLSSAVIAYSNCKGCDTVEGEFLISDTSAGYFTEVSLSSSGMKSSTAPQSKEFTSTIHNLNETFQLEGQVPSVQTIILTFDRTKDAMYLGETTTTTTLPPIFNVALVCLADTCADANKDVPYYDRLAAAGHIVTRKSATSFDTSSYDAIVISESVSSSATAWLKDEVVGILTVEGANNDEFCLGTGGDSAGGVGDTVSDIIDNTHYITSIFPTGTRTLSTASTNIGYISGWANGVKSLVVFNNDNNLGWLLYVDRGGALASFGTGQCQTPGGNWANDSFDKCMDITISNVGSSTLTNFPAYINVMKDNDMLSNYQDLRFYSTSCNNGGSLLDYEMENYTTESVHSWVRIPSLPAAGTTVSVYYDNNTAVESGENRIGVWDKYYVGVWHLAETSGEHLDSTADPYNAIKNGEVDQDVSGIVDGADDFGPGADQDDILTVTDTTGSKFDITAELTLEVWAKERVDAPENQQRMVHKRTSSTSYSAYGIYWDDDESIDFRIYETTTPRYRDCSGTVGEVTEGIWQYIATTFNDAADEVKTYVNGSISTTCSGWTWSPIITNNENVEIGGVTTRGSRQFNGTIDEVRISNTTRSDDWISQSYQMVANQGTYALFGSEESKPIEAAAERRVFFGGQYGNQRNSDNWELFDRALDWVLYYDQ